MRKLYNNAGVTFNNKLGACSETNKTGLSTDSKYPGSRVLLSLVKNKIISNGNWMIVLLFTGLLGAGKISNAQISVPSPLPYSYSEGFSGFTGDPTSLPAGWTASSSGTANIGGTGTGTSATGGYWAYGISGEYSLGALRSGSPGNITYTVTFRNTTGATITALTLSWDYEQWRYGTFNTSGFDCSGTGGLAGNTTLNAKDFAGVASGTNGTVSTTAVSSFTLTGLSIANNATFGLSFVTTDGPNADNGVAIDNFSINIASACTAPGITAQPLASQSVCQNLAATQLSVTATGTTPTYQWYSNTVNSNTTGTAITGQTGSTYTPSTSVAGTVYYYCVVTGCSSSVPSATASVTVNVPQTATVSYPGTPFCSDAGIQAVVRTGTAGGAYSVSPAGLNINASTGDVNPALSTAAAYTVTYSIAATGGCPIQNFTAPVTITAKPAATIAYASPICKTAGPQIVSRSGTSGGTYSALPSGLSINSATGDITPSLSTEGTYTITYSMAAPGNGCNVPQTATTTVTIASTTTSIAPLGVQDLSTNTDGTDLIVAEGGAIVSRQWKYGATPGGPYTVNVGTGATLYTPNFAAVGTYYVVCVTTYPASPCGGLVVTSNEVRVNVSNNSVVTTATGFGPFCNNSANPVSVNFTYSPAANFPAGVASFTAQLSDGNGLFTTPTTIGTITSDGSGTQTIAATIPAGVAGGTAFRIRIRSTSPSSIGSDNGTDFIIGSFPSASITYPGSPFCSTTGVQTVSLTGTTGGVFSTSAGLTLNASTGSITPSSSTAATYLVTYSLAAVGTCPSLSVNTNVTVNALPAAAISYATSPFCSNSGVQTVTRTGTTGGTYSSTAGLSINSGTGDITPSLSTPATYVVTYSMTAGGCTVQTDATSVTITQAPSATISYTGNPFCSNDITTKTVTRTGTSGGTYTASPTGLTINASTGEVTIFSSTPGAYTITYTMSGVGGCTAQTATTPFTINTAPVVASIVATPSTTVLVGGTTTVSCATPGGTWSSSNAAKATVNGGGLVTGVAAGTPLINYTVTSGGCSTVSATAINVLSAAGTSLWSNPITGTNPSSSNPYTAGDIVNANVSVSGIGYGVGSINPNTGNDRYNITNWTPGGIDLTEYISFTLTPDAGYAVDFTSFVYTDQASSTGPSGISIRSSADGFGSDIATVSHAPGAGGGTVSLTAPSFQNITSPITFRIYGYSASALTGTYSVNDFNFFGNLKILCTSPDAIEFVTQPSDVMQDAVMSPVLVRAKCTAGNTTGAAFNGPVVLSVFTGCGYVSQTVNAVNGIATFNNVVFTRSAQAGVQLQAVATGFPVITSNTFNVTIPAGVPSTVNIASENFEAGSTWTYTTGSPIVIGSGGTSGTDVITIKTFAGNKSLVKSYSVDNASGKLGTTNTITFANQLISAAYTNPTFTFQIASLGTGGVGSGAGTDNGEQMSIETSLDGGATWSKLLTVNGNSDYLFPFSSTPVASLAYNANATYNFPSSQSAFSVVLPGGTTQFRLRMTASDNRIQENWSIDNLSLTATSLGAGAPKPLPTVTGGILTSCPATNKTITVATSNTIGVVSYAWTPATDISNVSVSNPTVNPPAATVYTAVIADADGCKASGTVSITMPGGTSGTWTGSSNTDWFQCENWGAGVIPTNLTNVTIPATAINVAEIDPLSTFATAFGGVANANNITIDNKILRTQANASLVVAGNLAIQNNGQLDMANGGQVDLSGSWTKATGGVFTSGTGTINYAGSAAQTIAAENYYDLKSSSTGTRTMANAGTIGIANSFTPSTNVYTFTGSTIDYNGAINQNIAVFTANAASVGKTYNNLTLSNAGIKSVVGNTDVEGALSLSNTVTLAVQNNIVNLKSTVTQTARVAPVSASAAVTYGASGNFVVERYFPGRRAWRLITAPVSVTSSKSIFNSWQVGGPTGAAAPVGSGTYVTGPTPGSNGFDVSPVVSQPSLKIFNTATSQFDPITSTKTTLISGTSFTPGTPANTGFFMFVRGDRTPSNTWAFTPYYTVNETTLRDTGKIQLQSYQFSATANVGINRYTVVGNPYASPVDFANLTRSGVANKFWAWDPKLNVVGGYAIVDLALGNVTTVPAGGATTQTQIIQSKQAIVIESTSASSPTITFNETAKSSTNDLTLFRPSAPPAVKVGNVAVNLSTVNADGTTVLADGVLAQFRHDFSNAVDELDGLKWTNVNETFSILHDGQSYMLQRRKPVQLNDTIFLSLKRSRQINYRFNLMLNDMAETRLSAYLEDRYLHTSTPVNMEGSTSFDFNVTSTAASNPASRFYIVFKKSFNCVSVKADIVQNDALVQWTMKDKEAVSRYEIERSADGEVFEKTGTLTESGNASTLMNYQWFDKDLATGTWYYRIKIINQYGAMDYSDIVKVKMMSTKSPMYVFPNPVSNGTIGLQLNSQPAGKYGVRLLNEAGQTVLSQQLTHAGGTASHGIRYPVVASGAYQLEVTTPGKKQTVLKVQVVQ